MKPLLYILCLFILSCSSNNNYRYPNYQAVAAKEPIFSYRGDIGHIKEEGYGEFMFEYKKNKTMTYAGLDKDVCIALEKFISEAFVEKGYKIPYGKYAGTVTTRDGKYRKGSWNKSF